MNEDSTASSKIDKSGKYEVKLSVPGELDELQRAACVAVIRKGNAVDPNSAARELPRAGVLVIAYAGQEIVGVGVIKRPRPAYAEKIAHESGVPFPPDTLELGYVAVAPDHQGHGLSHRIAKLLVAQHSGGLFATTDNERMKKTLAGAGFANKGKQWEGNRGMLSFWERL
jgi:GNAT superfamily N-acetyltransferase